MPLAGFVSYRDAELTKLTKPQRRIGNSAGITGRTTMNRRHLTIMTFDDHSAAAREWATVHRCVAEFDNIIRFGCRVPERLRANVKRILRDLDGIRREMHELQARTRIGDSHAHDSWQEIISTEAPAAVTRATTVLPLDQHITAARALGAAKLAILRFMKITGDRRHLPVRILDFGLRIEHEIHAVQCVMDDVQHATLRGRDRLVDCWLGHFNYFDGDEAGSTGQDKTILEAYK
jgi:hypothetical protein